MEERKNELFRIIVEEYIKSAAPVGSGPIAEKYFPDLSSATIRNDMAELEANGLIYQPHTSAGRVPTLKGYQFYLGNFLAAHQISARNQKFLDQVGEKVKSTRDDFKLLAKALAEISGEAVVIGFAPNDVYYTGMANLFRQPEFLEQSLVYSMSDVIDHLDEAVAKIFHRVGRETEILLGENNPFGDMSSAILAKFFPEEKNWLVGILGPNRMDYRENLGLIKYAQKIIS